jgi:hypothetical protein
MRRVINVDKNSAYLLALTGLKADGTTTEALSSTRIQVFKEYRGAGSSECETPNMARQRLRFPTDRVAHFARNRGMEMLRKGRAKRGGQGQRRWPGEVHLQLVRHRSFIPLTGPFFVS